MTVIGSVNRTRPLGRRTRRHSRSTALRSYMWLIESMQIAASNEPASTGSVLRASTHTKRARSASPRSCAARLAAATPSSCRSTPKSRQPVVSTVNSAGPPEPLATSSSSVLVSTDLDHVGERSLEAPAEVVAPARRRRSVYPDPYRRRIPSVCRGWSGGCADGRKTRRFHARPM